MLLRVSAQDALELTCVKESLSRVKSDVLSASEGLFEASAGGGVLLMGNRVAHPISQVWFGRSVGRPAFRFNVLLYSSFLVSVSPCLVVCSCRELVVGL